MTVYAKEVTELKEGGFAYTILYDGKPWIYQPFKPAVRGKQLMSQAEANALADTIIAKLSARRTEQEEIEYQGLVDKLASLKCPACGASVRVPGHYISDINVLTLTEQTRLKQLASVGSAALSADEVVQKCQEITKTQEIGGTE
jgi:hypothetical protein